jgi:hypothetical protein
MHARSEAMGVFFERSGGQPIEEALSHALSVDPANVPDVEAEAKSRAAATKGDLRFQPGRFLISAAIFLAIVVAAIWAESANLADSSKALFGFAATIFGVIVGLLGAEKSSA